MYLCLKELKINKLTMKRQMIITLALALTMTMPTFAQKAMTKKEIAEKEKAFKNLQNPWKGKKVAYFGDSITDPNIKASKVKYWGFLEEWLGITPYVYGVSGRQWNDIPRQADKLKKEHGDNFDAILIFMGTNDYNNGVPIGDWYTETFDSVRVARHKPSEMVLRRHRHFAMDKNTLKGRINIAMSKLKQMYPTKQIVVMTPVHRAYFASSDKNIQPDEMYENARGLFFDEYVKAIKEVGNVWAVPVIDLNSLSGLFPIYDAGAQMFNKMDTDLAFIQTMPVMLVWQRPSCNSSLHCLATSKRLYLMPPLGNKIKKNLKSATYGVTDLRIKSLKI